MENLFTKIFPIEQSPSLVYFIQTPLGKVLGLMLFCLPLTFILPAMWPWIFIALIMLMLFPKYRLIVLFLINTCFWILSPFLNWKIFPFAHKQLGVSQWLFQILIVFCLISVMSLILFFAKKTTYRNLLITLMLFFYIFGAHFAEHIPRTRIAYSLVWPFIWIFGKFFWFLIYAIIDIKKTDYVLSYIFSMQPFWGLGLFLPIPGGFATMKKNEVHGEQYAVCQLKAIKLIYWIAIISTLWMVISRFFTGYTLMSHPDVLTLSDSYLRTFLRQLPSLEIGNQLFHSHEELIDYALFRKFQAQQPTQLIESAGRSIIFLLTILTQIVNTNLVWIGASVAISRMAGFYALRSVYRPHMAGSFSDFWGRWVHYYKYLVLKVFFIPIYQFFRFISSGKIRKISSLFIALFLAGMLFHFDRIIRLQLLDAAHSLSAFERWLRFLPYASIVAITVTLSRITGDFNFIKGALHRLIFIPLYLFILLIITTLYFYIFSDISWYEFIHFLKINFFLNFLSHPQ